MSSRVKNGDVFKNADELDKLYQIYIRVQSGEKTALDELFKTTDRKQISKADELNKKYQRRNMDNILDVELILENEKNKQEEEWINSVYSNVSFRFSCLNKMLYKKKKKFLSQTKNIGYENGQKVNTDNCSKFYEGEYDISDFNELMYETIIEIFNAKTDENNCLTLEGKLNENVPICDGISLLKNISYFVSRKINIRAGKSYLDISDIGSFDEDSEDDTENAFSYFDEYVFKEFYKSKDESLRLTMYAECLKWLKRNDIHKLFNVTACDINAIIDTILNCKETFVKNVPNETGFGMRFVTQKTLQEIIQSKQNINIEQTNITKNMKIIEQRLLDHLLYSLNYRIGKARESNNVYEKESERFLYQLDNKAYIKMFCREIYEIYNGSVDFIRGDGKDNTLNRYLKLLKKHEDSIADIVSLEKGKKKYDMINLLSERDRDLVDDEKEAAFNIANKVTAYYQNKENVYIKSELADYEMQGFLKWNKSYWEAELESDALKIILWSSEDAKKPTRFSIDRGKVLVYCGCMNFYFCDTDNKICYCVPKDRRIISKSNKNHEITIYHIA